MVPSLPAVSRNKPRDSYTGNCRMFGNLPVEPSGVSPVNRGSDHYYPSNRGIPRSGPVPAALLIIPDVVVYRERESRSHKSYGKDHRLSFAEETMSRLSARFISIRSRHFRDVLTPWVDPNSEGNNR